MVGGPWSWLFNKNLPTERMWVEPNAIVFTESLSPFSLPLLSPWLGAGAGERESRGARMNKQDKMEVILMVSSMLTGPRDPVDDDETQAHGHQQEANRSKTKGLLSIRKESQASGKDSSLSTAPAHGLQGPSYQDFRGGSCRLLLIGHDSEVEDGREDEDEARSRCSTCKEQNLSNSHSRSPIGQGLK